jgi:hypothetical protein
VVKGLSFDDDQAATKDTASHFSAPTRSSRR